MLNTAKEKCSKHVLIRADEANELFARYVSKLKPNPTVLKLCQSVLTDMHADMRTHVKNEIAKLRNELASRHVSIHKVEDLLVTGGDDTYRYSKILERYENEVKELETRIEMMEIANRTKIKPKLDYVIPLINNLVMYIRDAPIVVKNKLIGSIFPEKIEFDGKTYRTKHVNMLIDVRSQRNKELGNDKAQKKEADFTSFQLGGVQRTRTAYLNTASVALYQMS